MKSITYISQVVSQTNGMAIPKGLSGIYSSARRKNAELDISGFLSFRLNHYIQTIEGPDTAVDALFEKICADPRHTQVTVLIERSIEERAFADWSMKLLTQVRAEPAFHGFIRANLDYIVQMSDEQRALLDVFIDIEEPLPKYTKTYHDKDLKLLNWPDFKEIKEDPALIELCARLTHTKQSYKQLVASNEFGSAAQLDKTLDKFQELGILIHYDADDNSTSADAQSAPSDDSLYTKVKSFLSLS